MLLLFGFTWVTIHHCLGGIRHLIWDTGKGFELDKVEALARANIIGSVVLTFLVWLVIFWVKA
jgi:succinate dehydrogenase / fumarate reductase cytochrome b subunit